jgi:hypothetical protein
VQITQDLAYANFDWRFVLPALRRHVQSKADSILAELLSLRNDLISRNINAACLCVNLEVYME